MTSYCKYERIIAELKARIGAGVYDDGFPSVRRLRAEYRVSSRTIGKAFQILRSSGAIRPGHGGTRIDPDRRPRPDTRCVGLLGALKVRPGDGSVGALLSDALRAAGYTPLLLGGGEGCDVGLADGYVFLNGSFHAECARRLREAGKPFVVGNRMPMEYGVHWVDWNHRNEFTAIVSYLVACGYRRLALFHYLYPGMLEHWRLIYDDFIAESREFQLRNPGVELFVPEHAWDCDEFIEFWLRQSRLPEVVIRIGDMADGLVAAAPRYGLTIGRDFRVLSALFADGGNAVIAGRIKNLMIRLLRNPCAVVRPVTPTPKMIFHWLGGASPSSGRAGST